MMSTCVDVELDRGQCETTRMFEAFLDRCRASKSREALLIRLSDR